MATYKEALENFESFMGLSGIRFYCQEICRGSCCHHCFESDKSCVKNEGRRLSCSAYLCLDLRSLIFSSEEDNLWEKLESQIRRNLDKLCGGNSYFIVHKKGVQKDFYIADEALQTLQQIDPEKIHEKIHRLRELITKSKAIKLDWQF